MKPHLGRYDKAGIEADGEMDKQALQMGLIDLIIQSITDLGEGERSVWDCFGAADLK